MRAREFVYHWTEIFGYAGVTRHEAEITIGRLSMDAEEGDPGHGHR